MKELDKIREEKIVYSDGKVEKAEAEFLFRLRKGLNDLGNLKAWDDFFVQAIRDYILNAEDAVNERDAQWLIEQIGEDNVIDTLEQRLLKKLRTEARHFPACLQEISNHTSALRDFRHKIFLHLYKNSKIMRAMEYGVSKTGHSKTSVRQIVDKYTD